MKMKTGTVAHLKRTTVRFSLEMGEPDGEKMSDMRSSVPGNRKLLHKVWSQIGKSIESML